MCFPRRLRPAACVCSSTLDLHHCFGHVPVLCLARWTRQLGQVARSALQDVLYLLFLAFLSSGIPGVLVLSVGACSACDGVIEHLANDLIDSSQRSRWPGSGCLIKVSSMNLMFCKTTTGSAGTHTQTVPGRKASPVCLTHLSIIYMHTLD